MEEIVTATASATAIVSVGDAPFAHIGFDIKLASRKTERRI